MKARGRFQGMLTIAHFNWPLYVTALAVLLVSGAGLVLLTGYLQFAAAMAFAGAAYFSFVSLGVAYWVYDRSDLYRWSWLERALKASPVRQAIFCHAGFDESSAELRARFGPVHWRILDHYDAQRMTEPSIHRARLLFPPAAGTLTCASNAWPLAAGSADAVLALLAIHELRSERERTAWFAEAKRCLRKGGRVVLVEHVRDAANFLAFGPGFLHFHSCASWRRCWEDAGLAAVEHFQVTPFVRVFLLSAP